RLVPAAVAARRAVESLMLRLFGMMEEGVVGPLRLDDDFPRHQVWADGLERELDATLAAFGSLAEHMATVADRLAQAEMTERRNRLLLECRGVLRRLEAVSDGLSAVLRPAAVRAPDVRWIDRTGPQRKNLQLAAVPLDMAPLLRSLLFDRLDTVALTSATLAASGDFGFFASRVGLSGEDSPVTVQEIFPSPFDYGEQCLLGVPD